MTALRAHDLVTIEAFDAFVDAQAAMDDARFELVDGEIVMQSNPTEAHEQIVANIAAPLKFQADKRPCRTYIGGMRIQRSEARNATDKPRPDIMVRCGSATGRTFVTDPLIVVEVLSPSTMDVDRGRKLEFYKSLQTIRHIALVYQDQRRIEHYRRTDTGFETDVLTQAADQLAFEAVDFAIALDIVYFGVEL